MPDAYVVIIDDNQDSVDVLAQLLRYEKVPYITTNNPQSLTPDSLKSIRVIFLDLDLHLPDIDGYHVFKMLKKQLGYDGAIFAYTVNTNEKATLRQMGFDGLIAKPVDFNCFHDQWQQIINGGTVWDDCT